MPNISLPTTFGDVRTRLNDTGLRKNNWGATTNPGTSNNAAEGYEVGSRWINTTTRTRWTLAGFSGQNALWVSETTDYADVTNKPASFPPSAHQHPISDVTGLQTALDGKAAASHTHAVADVTGLQTALNGKAATSHTHAIADVSGLQTALDGKAPSSSVWTLEQIQDAVAAMFQGGTHTNASVTYDDAAGTISVSTVGGGGGGDGLTQEQVEDMVGNLVVQGTGITVSYDDAGNVLSIALSGESFTTAEKNKLAGIATGATANASNADLRDRGTHTGAQAISTVTGLQAALDAKLESSLVSSFALTLLDDTTQAAMRTTLGLGTLATLNTIANTNITNATITDAKLVNMPATTIKGNAAGAAAAPANLTVAQVKTMLALAISDVSNLQSALDGKVSGGVSIWTGTRAAYDAITPKVATALYFVQE